MNNVITDLEHIKDIVKEFDGIDDPATAQTAICHIVDIRNILKRYGLAVAKEHGIVGIFNLDK